MVQKIPDGTLQAGLPVQPSVLVIACGALAREILCAIRASHLSHIEVTCLPARLHNHPDQIPVRLAPVLDQALERYDKVFVAYGDCGTGGTLDRLLADRGVERLPGAHCYAFFAGLEHFDRLMADEPGTFFLTDFLARQFDAVIMRGMGLDRRPELIDIMFANYHRLVYLAQTEAPDLQERARAAAVTLGLRYERVFVGYGIVPEALRRWSATVEKLV